MRRNKTAILVVFTLLTAFVVPAEAQPRGRYSRSKPTRNRRPTVSPYLDLIDNGRRGAGFNYYRRIRPEREQRRVNSGLRRELETLEQRTTAPAQSSQAPQGIGYGMRPTGHSATFLDTGSFFTPSSASRARRR